MATNEDQVADLKRGAFPALMTKVGVIQNEIDLTDVVHTNSIEVFSFSAPTLLLAVGMTVTEPAVSDGSAGTIDLGDAEDGAEYASAQNPHVAAGTELARATAATNSSVLKAAGSSMVLSIDTATFTAGKVRVWALVADVADLAG